MLHKDILAQLMPVHIGGVIDTDFATEGAILDAAMARAAELLNEIFPDTANGLLAEWERFCNVTPNEGDNVQQRKASIITQLRQSGAMTAAYYTGLAESMGYAVTIDEPFATEGPHAWRMTFTGLPLYDFNAGDSYCGELLLDWPSQTAAEGLFQEIKPAHSRLIIAYS